MTSLAALWLPILVSAVLIFVASALIHMLLRYHNSDYARLPDEDAGMEALRRLNIPPGDYVMPNCSEPGAMQRPEVQEKLKRGPLAFLTIRPGGSMNMGPMMVQWFIYTLVISTLVAWLAGHMVPTGAAYATAFHVTAVATFLAYGGSQAIESIWYSRSWSTTFKNVVDGLIYALVAGGVFGWLWPR